MIDGRSKLNAIHGHIAVLSVGPSASRLGFELRLDLRGSNRCLGWCVCGDGRHWSELAFQSEGGCMSRSVVVQPRTVLLVLQHDRILAPLWAPFLLRLWWPYPRDHCCELHHHQFDDGIKCHYEGAHSSAYCWKWRSSCLWFLFLWTGLFSFSLFLWTSPVIISPNLTYLVFILTNPTM